MHPELASAIRMNQFNSIFYLAHTYTIMFIAYILAATQLNTNNIIDSMSTSLNICITFAKFDSDFNI